MSDVEAMQWTTSDYPDPPFDRHTSADEIVAWVEASGGEAVYRQHGSGIAVRNRYGWAYCSPGQWVVRTYDEVDDWTAGYAYQAFTVADSRPGVSSEDQQ